MDPSDLAFGRLVIERGLLSRDVVTRSFERARSHGVSLKDELVASGLLDAKLAGEVFDLVSRPETAATIRQAPDLSPPASAPSLSPLPRPGDELHGYSIQALLGEGGMGAVFQARHLATGALAAIKVIRADQVDGDGRIRFEREVAAMARVDGHPAIVRVRASGAHGPRQLPYVIMDFVPGRDLARELEQGPLAPAHALELAEKLALALHHCHERGIVHRDLKPANVILREGTLEPVLTDFGLARDSAVSGLTRSGTVLGTYHYMPPEQAGGESAKVDARSDVYALGAILFECLTGRTPFFDSPTVAALTKAILFTDPPDPCRLVPGLARDVGGVVLRCLAKEKLDRYPSALELAEDLARARRGEATVARPVSAIEWLRRRLRRSRIAHVSIGVALALGVTVFAVEVFSRLKEKANKQASDDLAALTTAQTDSLRDLEDAGSPASAPEVAALASARVSVPLLEAAERRNRVPPARALAPARRRWLELLEKPELALEGPVPDAPAIRELDAAAALRIWLERRDARARDRLRVILDRKGEKLTAIESLLAASEGKEVAVELMALESKGRGALDRARVVALRQAFGKALEMSDRPEGQAILAGFAEPLARGLANAPLHDALEAELGAHPPARLDPLVGAIERSDGRHALEAITSVIAPGSAHWTRLRDSLADSLEQEIARRGALQLQRCLDLEKALCDLGGELKPVVRKFIERFQIEGYTLVLQRRDVLLALAYLFDSGIEYVWPAEREGRTLAEVVAGALELLGRRKSAGGELVAATSVLRALVRAEGAPVAAGQDAKQARELALECLASVESRLAQHPDSRPLRVAAAVGRAELASAINARAIGIARGVASADEPPVPWPNGWLEVLDAAIASAEASLELGHPGEHETRERLATFYLDRARWKLGHEGPASAAAEDCRACVRVAEKLGDLYRKASAPDPERLEKTLDGLSEQVCGLHTVANEEGARRAEPLFLIAQAYELEEDMYHGGAFRRKAVDALEKGLAMAPREAVRRKDLAAHLRDLGEVERSKEQARICLELAKERDNEGNPPPWAIPSFMDDLKKLAEGK